LRRKIHKPRFAAIAEAVRQNQTGQKYDKSHGKYVGLNKGKAKGEAIGKAKGKAIGKAKGKAIGKAKGKAIGKAVGKAIGKAIGKVPTAAQKQARTEGERRRKATRLLCPHCRKDVGNRLKPFANLRRHLDKVENAQCLDAAAKSSEKGAVETRVREWARQLNGTP